MKDYLLFLKEISLKKKQQKKTLSACIWAKKLLVAVI